MRAGAMLPSHEKRHCAAGTTALAVATLVAACIALGSAPASAKQRAGERTGHFIEFLARPTEYLVDHAFVRIGRTARNGRDRDVTTVAFFPAGYPDIGLTTPLFDTRGDIRSVAEDHPARSSARFRVWVDAAVYRKAVAHAAWMRRHWRRYDLLSRNCNAVLFEYADRLGLAVPKLHIAQSSMLVREIAAGAPRKLRAWKSRLPA